MHVKSVWRLGVNVKPKYYSNSVLNFGSLYLLSAAGLKNAIGERYS
jgi:hypothetical protein